MYITGIEIYSHCSCTCKIECIACSYQYLTSPVHHILENHCVGDETWILTSESFLVISNLNSWAVNYTAHLHLKHDYVGGNVTCKPQNHTFTTLPKCSQKGGHSVDWLGMNASDGVSGSGNLLRPSALAIFSPGLYAIWYWYALSCRGPPLKSYGGHPR